MPQPAIATSVLSKLYGSTPGLLELDLEIRAGEIFGFLGPNGAGKTTTIRLLLGFLRPSSGDARVLGLDFRRESRSIRAQVGYLPGELSLYGNLSGAQLLRYLGSLHDGVDEERVRELSRRLDAELHRPLRTLSHGNRQKIGLVQALMHEAPLLVLDEPTTGLDPLAQQVVYELLDEERERGRTIFLSSHVLPEVERICDRVAMIRDARLVAVEDVEAMRRRAVREVEIGFAAAVDVADFAGIAGVHELRVNGRRLGCTVHGSMGPLLAAASPHGIEDVISHEPRLEQVFLALYGEGGHAP